MFKFKQFRMSLTGDTKLYELALVKQKEGNHLEAIELLTVLINRKGQQIDSPHVEYLKLRALSLASTLTHDNRLLALKDFELALTYLNRLEGQLKKSTTKKSNFAPRQNNEKMEDSGSRESKLLLRQRAAILYERGVTYRYMGNKNAALADLKAVVVLTPTHADAYLHQGILYLDDTKFNLAIKCFSDVLKLDAGNEQALLLRSRCYQHGGRYQQAAIDALRLSQHFPDNRNHRRLFQQLKTKCEGDNAYGLLVNFIKAMNFSNQKTLLQSLDPSTASLDNSGLLEWVIFYHQGSAEQQRMRLRWLKLFYHGTKRLNAASQAILSLCLGEVTTESAIAKLYKVYKQHRHAQRSASDINLEHYALIHCLAATGSLEALRYLKKRYDKQRALAHQQKKPFDVYALEFNLSKKDKVMGKKALAWAKKLNHPSVINYLNTIRSVGLLTLYLSEFFKNASSFSQRFTEFYKQLATKVDSNSVVWQFFKNHYQLFTEDMFSMLGFRPMTFAPYATITQGGFNNHKFADYSNNKALLEIAPNNLLQCMAAIALMVVLPTEANKVKLRRLLRAQNLPKQWRQLNDGELSRQFQFYMQSIVRALLVSETLIPILKQEMIVTSQKGRNKTIQSSVAVRKVSSRPTNQKQQITPADNTHRINPFTKASSVPALEIQRMKENTATSTGSHKLGGYPHHLMCKVGKPEQRNLAKGYYLYKTEQSQVVALVVHDDNKRETINLTAVDKRNVLDQLIWPARQTQAEYVKTTFRQELVRLIRSHCKYAHLDGFLYVNLLQDVGKRLTDTLMPLKNCLEEIETVIRCTDAHLNPDIVKAAYVTGKQLLALAYVSLKRLELSSNKSRALFSDEQLILKAIVSMADNVWVRSRNVTEKVAIELPTKSRQTSVDDDSRLENLNNQQQDHQAIIDRQQQVRQLVGKKNQFRDHEKGPAFRFKSKPASEQTETSTLKFRSLSAAQSAMIFKWLDHKTLVTTAPLVNKCWYRLSRHELEKRINHSPLFFARNEPSTVSNDEDPTTSVNLNN